MKKYFIIVVLILFGAGIIFTMPTVDNNVKNDFITEQDTLSVGNDIHLSAYPNPCDEQLNIKFKIAETNYIKLKIFDFNGNLVKTVIDDIQYSGETEHTVNFNASHLSSGAYELMLETSGKYKVGKFVVQR
jgi:hypothetical protein